MTTTQTPRSIPGPGFLESFSYFKRVPEKGFLNLLSELQSNYGEWSSIRIPNGQRMIVPTRPEDVFAILHTHGANFIKGKSVELFKLLIGHGLPVSDREAWRNQRRVLQPTFHRQNLEGYLEMMRTTTRAHARRWGEEPAQPFDATGAVARLTHDIIAKNLFGTDLGDSLHALQNAWNEALGFIVHRAFQPVRPPLVLPTAGNRQFRAAMRIVNQSVDRVIQRRLSQQAQSISPGTDGSDPNMLARLIKLRSEDGGEILTDRHIRDQVLAFLFAGHETTANNIAFTLYLILSRPEVEARIRREMETWLGGDAPLSIDLLGEMTYLRQVIYESLRLYPPAAIFVREAVDDIVISNYRIPRGAVVYISPYVIHRKPELWPQPADFQPERFAEMAQKNAVRKTGPNKFIAFGAGARVCIGEQFAMLEAQIVISTLLRHLSLKLVDLSEPTLIFNGTLRPGEIKMRAVPSGGP